MIDRFSYLHVLRLIYGYSTVSLEDLENFKLIDKDWEYLKALHETLGDFYVHTMKLQKPHHPTISEKTPITFALPEKLKSLKNTDASRRNPLYAYGLEKAREKLLEYYPLNDDPIASTKMLYLAIILDSRYN